MFPGTNRGQADGFDLDLLEHLNDFKNSAGNKSLLRMVVEFAHEQCPQVSDLDNELPHLNEATKTNFDEIRQKLQLLSNSVKDILFIMYILRECHESCS